MIRPAKLADYANTPTAQLLSDSVPMAAKQSKPTNVRAG
jgi:hypothetical protein